MNKNKRITLGALSLASVLAFNGCEKNSTNSLLEDDSVFEVELTQLQNIKEKGIVIEEKPNKVNIEKYEKELMELESIEIYYHDATHTLFISGIMKIIMKYLMRFMNK